MSRASASVFFAALALPLALAGCPQFLSDWTLSGAGSDGGGGDAGDGGDATLANASDAIDEASGVRADSDAVDSTAADTSSKPDASDAATEAAAPCSVAAGTCSATGGQGDCSNPAFMPYYCAACTPDACPLQVPPSVYCCASAP